MQSHERSNTELMGGCSENLNELGRLAGVEEVFALVLSAGQGQCTVSSMRSI